MLFLQVSNASEGWDGIRDVKSVFVVKESLRTMKSNNEYPFVVIPRCVPYILTYLAVVVAKVSSVTLRRPPVVVLKTFLHVEVSSDT